MRETYTFSRALHMMRYGGAKMAPSYYPNGYYFFIYNDVLKICKQYEEPHFYDLNSDDILGSLVEVKDEGE